MEKKLELDNSLIQLQSTSNELVRSFIVLI